MLRSSCSGARRQLINFTANTQQAVAGPSRLPLLRYSSDEAKNRPSPTPPTPPPSSSTPPPPTPPEPSQAAPQPDSTSKGPSPTDRNFTASQSHLAAEQDKLPLPWLDRPLGVALKPLRHAPTLTTSERAKAYVEGGRAEERRRLVQSATQGYFHDFHSLRSHGGKTWRAPNTLIRSDRARWFPNVEGTCLKDKEKKCTLDMFEGKVSVVTLLTSRISESHCKSFYEPTLDLYSPNPRFQLVQINLQPNLLKHYLISLFLSSVRSQIPEPLHATYLLSKLDLDSPTASGIHREDLNVHNKHVGYTYLVGPEGKIRWAGCGFAEKREREALLSCTGILLDR